MEVCGLLQVPANLLPTEEHAVAAHKIEDWVGHRGSVELVA
jgi:hypothetical protein